MSKVCECFFEDEDPNHPGYSAVEYDLVNPNFLNVDHPVAIRKNHETGEYELFDYTHDQPYTDDAVLFSRNRLSMVVRYARSQLGDDHVKYGHDEQGMYCEGEA